MSHKTICSCRLRYTAFGSDLCRECEEAHWEAVLYASVVDVVWSNVVKHLGLRPRHTGPNELWSTQLGQ